jgi:hypothetical protein
LNNNNNNEVIISADNVEVTNVNEAVTNRDDITGIFANMLASYHSYLESSVLLNNADIATIAEVSSTIKKVIKRNITQRRYFFLLISKM